MKPSAVSKQPAVSKTIAGGSAGDSDQPKLGPAGIAVSKLEYKFPNGQRGLHDVSFSLPSGSRSLIVGANGSGKTTLLRLLSGKRMAPTSSVSVGGCDPFLESLEGTTYLGLEWVMNSTVRTDIDVPTLLSSVGGDHFPARRDELLDVLDIDTTWRMHAVSDGERRRVQLAMGLIRPWKVLLLDEITVDLDLLSRHSFLSFLKRETESRQCTIVYATHILDNMANWPTHLIHIHMGSIKKWGRVEDLKLRTDHVSENSLLGELILSWLEDDRRERGVRHGLNGQDRTYQDLSGLGGYGQLKAIDR